MTLVVIPDEFQADSGMGRDVTIAYAREGADVLISYMEEHEDAEESKKADRSRRPDTPTTIQVVIGALGAEVGEIAYWLTVAEKGNRKARMTMSTWRIGRAPWGAKLIKLADIIDNMRARARSARVMTS